MNEAGKEAALLAVRSNVGLADVLTTKNAHPGHPLYDKSRMNELQEQVFALGICPRCHKKLLHDGHASYGIQSVSCACGLLIFTAANA